MTYSIWYECHQCVHMTMHDDNAKRTLWLNGPVTKPCSINLLFTQCSQQLNLKAEAFGYVTRVSRLIT